MVTTPTFHDEITTFIAAHGEPSRVEVLLPDMNGRLRGKSLPTDGLVKLAKNAVRMCWGTQALDIWGVDVDGVGVGAEIGDPDGICRPVPGTLGIARSRNDNVGPVAQVLVTMDMPDGTPCFLDPRVRLQEIIGRYTARKLTPVVAVELEFYLVALEHDGAPAQPPQLPGQQARASSPQVYDMDVAGAFAPVLDDISTECDRLNIPADTVIAEFGPGQFEINLMHVADAAKACDHAILFKRIVHSVALRHGYRATFMAKVYGDQPGSGCHIHASVLDSNGMNIFASNTSEASDTLMHAVGGCLTTARDVTALFAPHLNSYRRFAPGAFAPSQLNWGGDHRDVAIRIPEVQGPGARLEHRLAGADTNPYLLVAAVLGGMLHGMDAKILPEHRVKDHATKVSGPRLSHDWLTAIEEFAASDFVAEMFGHDYQSVYATCRRSECGTAMRAVTDFEFATYLPRL